MNLVWQDLRYALRGMRRAPLLTCVVTLALTAGIGLNAGIFAIIDSVWLSPPVTEQPASFAQVIPQYTGWFPSASNFSSFTFQDFEAVRAQSRSLTEVAASSGAGFARLDDSEQGGNSGADLVTCNYFSVFGIDRLVMGRLLEPADCAATGSAPVAVISEAMWRNHYASDPKIIGRTLRLDRHPFTIVGVVHSEAAAILTGGIWIPYTMQPEFYKGSDAFQKADWPWLTVSARLKDGYSRSDARADLAVILARQDKLISGRRTAITLTNGSLIERPDVKSFGMLTLAIVLGPMALVLLVACTNVTMVLLSRAASRQGEIAVRLALGASRKRLLRLLAMEGLVAAIASGALSVYLAERIPGLFWSFVMPERVWFLLSKPDWKVTAYLAGITLVAACFAGLAPARESLKVDLVNSIKGSVGGAASSRGRDVLIVAQIAMSFVLVAAGVLFASYRRSMASLEVGFETQHVMMVPLSVTTPPYTRDSAISFYQTLEQQIRGLPGVQLVSQASAVPYHGFTSEEIRLQGEDKGHGKPATAEAVSPEFFETLGIPIVRGRAFQDSDETAKSAGKVVVVSQAFEKAFWNGGDALGKLIELPDDSLARVVGVARDTKSEEYGIVDGPRIYSLLGPGDFGNPLLVRFAGDSKSLAGEIGGAVQKLDPEQLGVPQTLRSITDKSAESIGRLADVVLFMGFVAVVLAITGVYGVMAFSMSQRTREFGIRMALGATQEGIVRQVIGAGAKQVCVGLGAGIALAMPAAYAWAQITKNSPFPAGAFNFGVYAMSAALLLIASVAAMFVPARRAATVDPMVALRYE
ncbi:MAG TPA: ADOP family duplicated permease [Candidatus Acidoferrales bacterium]|nr:ADOP family duplicated permease [Candidatus Acidoferrales bacterium]